MTHTLRNMAAALLLLAATAAQAQTLTTDSVGKVVATSNAEVTISLAWPVSGQQTLVDGVRTYILNLLRDKTATYDYDNSGNAVKTSEGKRYTGDPADGQAIATFYATEMHKSLAKDAVDGAIDGVELPPFSSDVKLSKVWEGTTGVTYTESNYDYLGGAHGMYGVSGVTFSAATGKPVTEIINRSFENNSAMQRLIRKGLTSYFQSASDGSDGPVNLSEMLFVEAGQPIPLPATEPWITAGGVTFTYQPYEIAPYAAGAPEFTVPLSDIAPFLSASAKELVK